jgi:hypothetical protein
VRSKWQARVRKPEGSRSKEDRAWVPYRESRIPGSILVRAHFFAGRSASVDVR